MLFRSKGLFVIESKNYSGYIFGNENNREWTSTLYAGKNFIGFKQVEKHHFYNPIWQNRTHINCLKRIIDMDIPMHSLIVFSDRCEFKDVRYSSSDTWVIHKRDLSHEIKSIWDSSDDVISEIEVEGIYYKLLKKAGGDEEIKAQHVVQIKSGSSSSICPLCGGKLVLRTAKQGPYAGNQFYGCSNYPKCRYTRNI